MVKGDLYHHPDQGQEEKEMKDRRREEDNREKGERGERGRRGSEKEGRGRKEIIKRSEIQRFGIKNLKLR